MSTETEMGGQTLPLFSFQKCANTDTTIFSCKQTSHTPHYPVHPIEIPYNSSAVELHFVLSRCIKPELVSELEDASGA